MCPRRSTRSSRPGWPKTPTSAMPPPSSWPMPPATRSPSPLPGRHRAHRPLPRPSRRRPHRRSGRHSCHRPAGRDGRLLAPAKPRSTPQRRPPATWSRRASVRLHCHRRRHRRRHCIIASRDRSGTRSLPARVRSSRRRRHPRHRRSGPMAAQVVLPFTGLNTPGCGGGHASAPSTSPTVNNRVVKLAAGSNAQEVLPFTGLSDPGGVAVDAAGTVYVTDGQQQPGGEAGGGLDTRRCCRSPASTAPSVWRWMPPATSTSPTGATIGW